MGKNQDFKQVRKRLAAQRMEKLDRGLVALRTKDGVFLSWRMFCAEDPIFGTGREAPKFTLLRDGAPIFSLSGKTCCLDRDGTMDSRYELLAEDGSRIGAARPASSGKNYFDIPLQRPAPSPYGAYTINDVSCGDLDGDGTYELIVKWDSAGKDNSEDGFTGNVLLDAYRMDGRRLWKQPIDLGVNIRAGAHYTQFLVYDLDRDGKSELILKTAPGSKDGAGNYVSGASSEAAIRNCDDTKDYRNENGHVLDGDEFLTVFRGETGEAIDTIWYPNQRIDVKIWGDSYGNRSERYTATIAWLDGERPYAFFMRGYYWGRLKPLQARQCACAATFDGERLTCRHCFDTFNERKYRDWRRSSSYLPNGKYKGVRGYRRKHERYVGEGNHNCIAADVDGDGRDEVLTGSLCYKLNWLNRLCVKWCSFRGHGDVIHLGAFTPNKDRLLLFTTHEAGGRNPVTRQELDHGASLHDAASGKTLFHQGAPDDTGRGMMANVGAGGWFQFWGVTECGKEKTKLFHTPHICTESGFKEMEIPGATANFRIFWDGDLYDELLDGESGGPLKITSWNGERMEEIFCTEGCVSINGTKANPCLQADLLGDWREELVMAREDNEALRVFISDIPTEYAMATLMHDPVYRAGVAAEQTAYNQPPHIGFYLGKECFK